MPIEINLDNATEKSLIKGITLIFCMILLMFMVGPFYAGGYWLFVGIPRCIYRACKKLYKRIKYGSVKTTELQKNELITDTK